MRGMGHRIDQAGLALSLRSFACTFQLDRVGFAEVLERRYPKRQRKEWHGWAMKNFWKYCLEQYDQDRMRLDAEALALKFECFDILGSYPSVI